MNVLNRWLKYVLLLGVVAGCGSKKQVLNTSKNFMPIYIKLNNTVKSVLQQGDAIEKENAQSSSFSNFSKNEFGIRSELLEF